MIDEDWIKVPENDRSSTDYTRYDVDALLAEIKFLKYLLKLQGGVIGDYSNE